MLKLREFYFGKKNYNLREEKFYNSPLYFFDFIIQK